MSISALDRQIRAVPPLPVRVPEGSSGAWRVCHFELTEEEATDQTRRIRMRHLFDDQPVSPIYDVGPGRFVKLVQDGRIWMSNTSFEVKTHKGMLSAARGHVLVAGLGIGMATDALLRKPEVTHVTVVENSPDVLTLTGPIYENEPRVTLIEADIATWIPDPSLRFDLAWFDIWPSVDADNLPMMGALRRRYEPIVAQAMCWAEMECLKQAVLLGDTIDLDARRIALLRSLPGLRGSKATRRSKAGT